MSTSHRLRRHRPRRRLAGRALRRRAGRGRPARRARRARAGRRRVLVLGLHPVEDAAAPGRGGARRARGGGDAPRSTSRRRSPGATSWSPNYSDAGAGALAGRQRHRPAARHRPARRDRASVEVDGVRHTAEHVVRRDRRRPVHPADPRPARARRHLDQPRGDRHEGGPAAAARARRRAGRASSWRRPCAASAARSCSSRAPSTCSPREPAPLGEALGEVLRRDGIELVLGAHATAARRDGDDYVLELDDGRELRGDRLLVATGRRPRVDGHRPRDASASRPTRTASRSTRTCAPASGCGRSATSPASGR